METTFLKIAGITDPGEGYVKIVTTEGGRKMAYVYDRSDPHAALLELAAMQIDGAMRPAEVADLARAVEQIGLDDGRLEPIRIVVGRPSLLARAVALLARVMKALVGGGE